MFPYVCLATMPLFCSVDWPRRLRFFFRKKQKILSINRNLIVKKTDQVKDSMKPKCLVNLPSNEISCNEAIHEGK